MQDDHQVLIHWEGERCGMTISIDPLGRGEVWDDHQY